MFRRTIGRSNHYVRFRGRGSLPPIPIRNPRADEEVGYEEDPDIYIEDDEDQGALAYNPDEGDEAGEDEEEEFENSSYEPSGHEEDEQDEVSPQQKLKYSSDSVLGKFLVTSSNKFLHYHGTYTTTGCRRRRRGTGSSRPYRGTVLAAHGRTRRGRGFVLRRSGDDGRNDLVHPAQEPSPTQEVGGLRGEARQSCRHHAVSNR